MEKYFDEIVNQTVKLIQFDSSLQPAEGNYPFGKGAGECLEYFLALASEMGFETHNYDNYIGEVVFGEGKDFAILAHLDVVPAGSGWTYPPFGGVINDEPSAGGMLGRKIWGRGAMDDKAPAVVCLYALKALKDEGILPNRTFKLIVGCNEESGFQCVEHYEKVATLPEEGFTPDADFPVIYAEKGILQFTAAFPMENPPFTALKGGERVNMVCAEATATLTRQAAEGLVYYENPIAGTRLSYDNTTNILRAYGKNAHGSQPHKGANALQAVLRLLSPQNEDCKKAYDCLFDDCAEVKTLQDETGELTMSPDVVEYKNGKLYVSVDIRYPATLPLDTVLEKIDSWGVEYQIDSQKDGLYNDPDGTLVKTLCGVYASVTGENLPPIAIGGGTYAKALKQGCGFGPQLKTQEVTIHQPNEYVTFDMLRLMSKIYYQAIKEFATAGQTGKKRKIGTAILTLCDETEIEEVAEEGAQEELPVNKVKLGTTCVRIGGEKKTGCPAKLILKIRK